MFRLISFDLDGTLFKVPACVFIGRKVGVNKEMMEYNARFERGEITMDECLKAQFGLLKGLSLKKIHEYLKRIPKIRGIRRTVSFLKGMGLRVIVLSDNADYICRYWGKYGFDDFVCSRAEIRDEKAGEIVFSLADKLKGLEGYCQRRNFQLTECIHVGDWTNDIPIFKKVGFSIALNARNEATKKAASSHLRTDNLFDVCKVLEKLTSRNYP